MPTADQVEPDSLATGDQKQQDRETEESEQIPPEGRIDAVTINENSERGSAQVDDLVPVRWPFNIIHLRESFNPRGVQFEYEEPFGVCGCATVCRHMRKRQERDSLRSQLLLFQRGMRQRAPKNGLPRLQLARGGAPGGFTVVAAEHIARGSILVEYLGKLVLETPRDPTPNEGYKLVMRGWAQQYPFARVCVDAKIHETIARFMNHSCRAAAHFTELANQDQHTAIVVSSWDIARGEEITVNYGEQLCFVCRCGESNSHHRHLH